jgi:hypothetical protein
MDMKWEISGKGRNSAKYGYYMLLILAAPDVRDHLSDREVSTVLFLPAKIGSMAGELPRTLQYLRTVDIHYHSRIQEVKSNVLFREAVQFCYVS